MRNLSAPRLLATALLSLVLGAGCMRRVGNVEGPDSAAGSGGQAKGPARTFTSEQIREVIADTAAARQLELDHEVQVLRVDPQKFTKLLHDDEVGGPEHEEEVAAYLLGFNLVPPPSARKDVSKASEVLDEQVVGFYEPRKDRIVVRGLPFHNRTEEVNQRMTLAHEAQHALQQQHFPEAKETEVADDDARIALLSLHEGDAMVAAVAYIAAEVGLPLTRVLRDVTDIQKKVSIEGLARSDSNAKLARALPITRSLLTFPYIEGMQFVADVYRAGGFSYVNELFKTPPQSTAQVIHPEKYVRGDAPATLDELPLPDGLKPLGAGRFGELRTLVMLSQCHPLADARNAAAGWAGDAYRVARRKGGVLVLEWVTLWDKDDDAVEFAVAANEAKCWVANELDEDETKLKIAAGVSVRQKGKRVALVRGLDEAAAGPALDALLAVRAVTPPPRKQTHAIPPRVPLPVHQPGVVHEDIFSSDWLGLQGRLPSGMAFEIGKDGLELSIERRETATSGALALSEHIVNDKFDDLTFNEIADMFLKALPQFHLSPTGARQIDLPLGPAKERTWVVDGTPLTVRAVMLPICASTGSLVFIETYKDDFGAKVVDEWMRSFRWLAGRNLPACDRLDPK